MTTKQRLLGLMIGMAATAPSFADEIPDLTLRYKELEKRETLKFSMPGHPNLTRSVGVLTWEFPPTTYATLGFGPDMKSYCIEPLIPVSEGREYAYRIDNAGTPLGFGLPNDEAGRKIVAQRTKFVRELYGRYYIDNSRDPQLSHAAFQTALWELTQEKEMPDGPMPFSLFTGTFKVDYPNLAEAPQFVQTAQKYLQGLTGDDSVFKDNRALAGMSFVRLTGINSSSGPAGQSHLALQSTGGSSSFPGPPQSIATTSTGGGFGQQMPVGARGNGGGFGGGSGGGSGGGQGGGFGGGLGGGFGNGGGNSNSDSDGGGGNPLTPDQQSLDPNQQTSNNTPSIVINNNPVFNNNNNNTNTNNNNPINNNTNNNSNNQSQNQNQNQQQQQQQNQNQNQNQGQNNSNDPGDPGDCCCDDPNGPNPVPAPPAAVLGLVAVGMFGLRKLRGRKQNS